MSVLKPGTYDYVKAHDKRDFVDVVKGLGIILEYPARPI